MKSDLSFLRNELNRFIRSKLQKPSGIVAMDSPIESLGMAIVNTPESKALLKELGIDLYEFNARFMLPWDGLTPSQVQRAFAIWGEYFTPRLRLEVDIKPLRVFEALRWTAVQMIELFPGVPFLEDTWDGNIPAPRSLNEIAEDEDLIKILYLAKDHIMPYRQCYMCGRLDTDKRGNAFQYNAKACHVDECKDSSSPDLYDHGEDCCYRKLRELKKSCYAKQAYYSHRSYKLIDKFHNICEQLYLANLERKIPLRALKNKPQNLKFIYES